MAAKGARVHVYGDWDGRGIKKAQDDLGSFGKNVDGFSKKVSSSFLGIGAAIGAAFSLDAVVNFMKGAAQAAMEDERSMVALAKAMENVGLAAQNAQVEGFIEELMLATGVADDQLRPALQSLVTATGDVETAQSALKLALDISAGSGRDLQSVSTALARAYGGQTTALSRLGVGIDRATLMSRDMDRITEALSSRFEGQAAAAASTYQGQMQRLTVAVDEARETIGYSLLNALNQASQAFGGPNGFIALIEKSGTEAANTGWAVSGLIRRINDLAASTSNAKGEQQGLITMLQNAAARYTNTTGLVTVLRAAMLRLAIEEKMAASATAAATRASSAYTQRLDAQAAAAREAAKAQRDYNNALSSGIFVDPSAAGFDAAAFYGVNPSAQRALAEARNNAAQLSNDYRELQREQSNVASSASGASSAIDTLADRIQSAREKAVAGINDMRTKLREQLDASREEFNNYAKSVSDSIRGSINFANAAPQFDEAGNRVGLTFIEALQQQATRAQEFATKVKTLIAMGLSQEALQQVLAAGVQAGTNIANELIAGGSTTIEKTNELVATTQAAADEVGLQAAQNFYGAGVETAQQTYEGFKANFGKDGPARRALMGVMDNLAAAAARDVRIDVAVTRSINEVVTRVVQTINAPVQPRAMGGPVSAGSPYLIGERGPELFVPDVSGTVISNRDLRGSGGSAIGSTINLTVNAGMGTNGAEVGRQIVDAISAYERRNGKRYASA